MGIRRVITGDDARGESVVASDDDVAPIELALMPGARFTPLWGYDVPPDLPNDGSPPPAPAYFPPAGGTRLVMVTIPPDGGDDAPVPSPEEQQAAVAEAEARLPGLVTAMEPDHPGFHRTDTVDLVYVVAGPLVLETTTGPPVRLETGDVVVQNGTRHAWRNPGSGTATMLSIGLGLPRSG